jgi:hypothetical protein
LVPLLIVVSALVQGPGPEVDLTQVQESLRSLGPKGTLHLLFDDGARWDSFLDVVGKGDDAWLEVAANLREVSDAHASETLDMAIQEALPVNPSSVLTSVQRGSFTVDGACGMYGFGQIEDQRPKAVIVGLVDRRIDSVSKVEQPTLEAVKTQCLAELVKLRAEIAK